LNQPKTSKNTKNTNLEKYLRYFLTIGWASDCSEVVLNEKNGMKIVFLPVFGLVFK
jgi:hypothetical protein